MTARNLLLEPVEYKVEETSFGVWKRFLSTEGQLFQEFVSHRQVRGLPLLHYTTGRSPETGKSKTARGFVAIGRRAVGFVAIGQAAFGVVAIGQLAVGVVFGLGQAATGVLALGQLAVGCAAAGQLAIGFVAAGQFAVGVVALGYGSLGWQVHRGGLTETPYHLLWRWVSGQL